MSRSHISLALSLLAVALVAVPVAVAKGPDRSAVRIQGACSQQSTSKLKLSREDRGVEVEFEVDQNRNGVPWTGTISRNGKVVTAFAATTRGPSGSFEVRRVIAGRLGTDRISATATRASGERCTANGSAPKTSASATPVDDHGDDGPNHS